ncbi:MAG TPA: metalloregulator ArsR/SmtB family transcription factor [Steroidobacteraceae bacterium]|nr:metalloregulator ArsR/SmtB family transcription factor [Steroidobacteraceae bacterium]
MNVPVDTDAAIATLAAVMGEPTRARILVSLLDGRARTGTELGAIAEVGASTVSAHLQRLAAVHLVAVRRQGKHRYYSLTGPEVAALLEKMSALAGARYAPYMSRAPERLRAARTCYDHIAGTVGVALRDRLTELGWLAAHASGDEETYEVSTSGASAFAALGIDLGATRSLRRRFAFGCLDWTERRYHLGGSLGAALLGLALRRRWVVQDLDSRALRVTVGGRRELLGRFGVHAP